MLFIELVVRSCPKEFELVSVQCFTADLKVTVLSVERVARKIHAAKYFHSRCSQRPQWIWKEHDPTRN